MVAVQPLYADNRNILDGAGRSRIRRNRGSVRGTSIAQPCQLASTLNRDARLHHRMQSTGTTHYVGSE